MVFITLDLHLPPHTGVAAGDSAGWELEELTPLIIQGLGTQ